MISEGESCAIKGIIARRIANAKLQKLDPKRSEFAGALKAAAHDRHRYSSDLTGAPKIFEPIAKLTSGITQADSGG